MESEKEPEIKIITDDEDSLKILGELLANKTSRDLLKFLMNKSAYKKKISDELGVPFTLVDHHLKKMEKLGLVKITNKKLIKNGINHKTYKITSEGIFVLLNTSNEVEKKGTIKKIFREGVKFSTLGIMVIVSWMSSVNHTIVNNIPIIDEKNIKIDNFSNSTKIIEEISNNTDLSFPIIISSIIFICGLFLIWFTKRK